MLLGHALPSTFRILTHTGDYLRPASLSAGITSVLTDLWRATRTERLNFAASLCCIEWEGRGPLGACERNRMQILCRLCGFSVSSVQYSVFHYGVISIHTHDLMLIYYRQLQVFQTEKLNNIVQIFNKQIYNTFRI